MAVYFIIGIVFVIIIFLLLGKLSPYESDFRWEITESSDTPQVIEKIVEVEKIIEIPVEKIIEVPVDRIVEKVIEIEKPIEIEKIVEVPVEKIVIKEVPVDRVIEKIIEVPVDRIVEKIVEVPVEKIIEIPVEMPEIPTNYESIDMSHINLNEILQQIKESEQKKKN